MGASLSLRRIRDSVRSRPYDTSTEPLLLEQIYGGSPRSSFSRAPSPPPADMAEIVPRPPSYDDKLSPDTVEKVSLSSDGKVTDEKMAKEVAAMEDRIEHDEATEDEYLVQNAYEVAVKVLIDLETYVPLLK